MILLIFKELRLFDTIVVCSGDITVVGPGDIPYEYYLEGGK